MRVPSLAAAFVHTGLLVTATGSGLLAAFLSQASAEEYGALLPGVAALAAVSVGSALAFSALVGGPLRWLPAGSAALAALGAGELAARAWF